MADTTKLRSLGKKADQFYGGGASPSGNIIYKGVINVPSDFPSPAANPQIGWEYSIGQDVTDNDPTRTNTGESFKQGDEIRLVAAPAPYEWIEVGDDRLWYLDGSIVKLNNNSYNTELPQELIVLNDVFSGKSGIGNGRFFARRSDGNPSTIIKADGRSNFPQGITDLIDPINPLDAVNLQTLDAHPGNNVEAVTDEWGTTWGHDDPIPISTKQFTLSKTPIDDAGFSFMWNGVLVTELYYSRVGTLVTWLEPTIGGLPQVLTSTDEVVIKYNYVATGGSTPNNIWENGVIAGGYQDSSNLYSKNPYINVVLYLPDPTIPNSIGRLAVSTGVTNGNIIDENALNDIIRFHPNKAASIEYGFAAETIEIVQPQISNISGDGLTATVIFNSVPQGVVANWLKIDGYIEIVGTVNYDGLHQITALPTGGHTVQFLSSATVTETSGYARIQYSPLPQHNQHGIAFDSQHNIRIIEDSNLKDGYYLDVWGNSGTDIRKIIPMGSVELRGISSNTAVTWVSTDTIFPAIRLYETIRLRKQKENKWWLEFIDVNQI